MNIERLIFESTLEYLYGKGVAKHIPWKELSYIHSKFSRRFKQIMYKSKSFATIKQNGVISISFNCVKFLLTSKKFKSCIMISDDAKDEIMKGGSVFCKHVIKVGPNVLPGIDVGVLTSSGELIAIGKAAVARPYMLSLKRGVAVKVRQGVFDKRIRKEAKYFNIQQR